MQFLVLQNYTGTYSYFQHLIFTQGRRARAAAGERKKNQNCQQLLKGAKKVHCNSFKDCNNVHIIDLPIYRYFYL